MTSDDDTWRIRIDFFAPKHLDRRRQEVLGRELAERIVRIAEMKINPAVSVDAGTGQVDRVAMIGLTFWLRAQSPGRAADLAVRLATDSFQKTFALEPDLYDVVVVPNSAVARPEDPHYPPVPD